MAGGRVVVVVRLEEALFRLLFHRRDCREFGLPETDLNWVQIELHDQGLEGLIGIDRQAFWQPKAAEAAHKVNARVRLNLDPVVLGWQLK